MLETHARRDQASSEPITELDRLIGTRGVGPRPPLARDLAATKCGRRRDPVNLGCPHRGSVLDSHRRDHGGYSADRDCAREALTGGRSGS